MPDNTEFHATLPSGVELSFLALRGREFVSALFEFEVDLVGTSDDVDKGDLLGKKITVHLPGESGARHFNGYVRRLERHGADSDKRSTYTVTLCPWLWFLTRARRSRIFQDKSATDIIGDVFDGYADVKDFRNDTSDSYPTRGYCVQYRETDFDFVSRLMEEEGIAYYFEHGDGKHTLVLVDDNTKFLRGPDPAKITCLPYGHEQEPGHEHIDDLRKATTVQTGKVRLRDYDFEKPATQLEGAASAADAGHGQGVHELYDYPGNYLVNSRGNDIAKKIAEEHESQREWIQGHGGMRNVGAGMRIEIDNPPAFVPKNELVVLAASHRMQRGEDDTGDGTENVYECDFLALDVQTPYRPPRDTPRARVEGLQTAIVTGSSGEEIYTDKYGRIKVQFYWDRDGKNDENTTCWVRVAMPWAGKNFGFLTLPRVGQEVVVSFLEGDPDRPLVVGSVYNAEQMPPWTLPDKAKFSGIRTHTVQGGTSDFNEFRFSDEQGSELVYTHAQKDLETRIKNDMKVYVANDADYKVLGERHELVTKDYSVKVDGAWKNKVAKTFGLDVGQDLSTKSGATISLHATQDVQVKAGANMAVDAASQIHLKTAMMVLEASSMITIKAGPATITLGPAGVTIDGPLVKVNCGGSGGSGSGANPIAPEAPTDAKDAREPES